MGGGLLLERGVKEKGCLGRLAAVLDGVCVGVIWRLAASMCGRLCIDWL